MPADLPRRRLRVLQSTRTGAYCVLLPSGWHQFREVAAAMELIYQNAEAWHCDTARIAIMGFSAGGHLTAHYSNAYDCPEVRALFPDSKPVQASILCYPVITADPLWAHLGSFNALTGKEERTAEEIEKLSCNKLVTRSTPPTFLWQKKLNSCSVSVRRTVHSTFLTISRRSLYL